jgi:spore maturation protein CgeB
MKLVVFGLAVSSSWGNGHATLWRALIRALARRGHHVVFFERDVPYYAAHRDLTSLQGAELVIYPSWEAVLPRARAEIASAEVAIVTSYCPDARSAAELVLAAPVQRVFYDLDTPVTLSQLDAGQPVDYLPPQGLGDFDLVLSYTGGRALDALVTRLGARHVAPLYGCVDPEVHRPAARIERYAAHASYLGTYAADRQEGLAALFLDAAARLRDRMFILGGSMYPADFPWASNIKYVPHVPPGEHPAFYGSSLLTLNVTRGAMAALGYCPSGRLFEAAACGVPVLSDRWEGLEDFFTPGEQILLAGTTDEAMEAYGRTPDELARIARAARERTLDEHTADRRVLDLERALRSTGSKVPDPHSSRHKAARSLRVGG